MLKDQFVAFKRMVYEKKVNEYVRLLLGQAGVDEPGYDPERQLVMQSRREKENLLALKIAYVGGVIQSESLP